MKKLLSILGSMGLVATASAGVVSCTQTIPSKDVTLTKDGKVTFQDVIFFEVGTKYDTESQEVSIGNEGAKNWFGVVRDDKQSAKWDSEYVNNDVTITMKTVDKIGDRSLRKADDNAKTGTINTPYGYKTNVEISGLKLNKGRNNFRLVSTYVKEGTTRILRSWIKFSVVVD